MSLAQHAIDQIADLGEGLLTLTGRLVFVSDRAAKIAG